MRKVFYSVFAGLGLLALSGCMSAPGGLSASTLPITSKDSYTVVRRDVEGTDSGVFFLGFPVSPLPSAYKALQNAKKDNKADGLINVYAENRYRYTLFLICVQTMVVGGDAIRFQVAGEDVE